MCHPCGCYSKLEQSGTGCWRFPYHRKNWITILESSYIVHLLPPYYENFSKRIIKSPKLYFYDTGLAAFLLGLRTSGDIIDSNMKGALFENLVITNMLKLNDHHFKIKEYWYWRDSNGHEVDLLTQQGDGLDIFEIKSTMTILPKLFSGMDYLSNITQGRVRNRTLIYGGNEHYDRTLYQIRNWRGQAELK
ncbi:MAG: DUF4143 domain-containing protein [Saprospiraceae bacterium]